jgi:hypothetical protein
VVHVPLGGQGGGGKHARRDQCLREEPALVCYVLVLVGKWEQFMLGACIANDAFHAV